MGYDVTKKRLAAEKSLPAVPKALGGEAVSALGAMREQVERLSGKTGDEGDRAVRLFEVEQGLLNVYMPSFPDHGVGDVPGSGGSRILKAPRNLKYNHMIFAIQLTWENVEPEYSHVEIWCAEDSIVLDDAKRVGIATKPMAEWSYFGVSMRVNYTFWIRAVGWDGGLSPWCPPQGQGGLIVPAEIDKTIEELLEILTGKLTESQLYQVLSERINLIDGPDSLLGSVAQRLGATEAQIDETIELLRERLALAESDFSAGLYAEQVARADADDAMAKDVNAMYAQVQANAAAIQTEQAVRADTDDALASQVDTLVAQVGTNTSAIQTERTVRASADESLTELTTTLFARVDEAEAAILSEESARVSADSVVLSKINSLLGMVYENAADIEQERAISLDEYTALASQQTELFTRVQNNASALQMHASTLNGLEAQWYVKTDVNGRVAGLGLYSTGVKTEFIVLSDKFMVVTPGQSPKVPFVVGPVGDTGVYGVGIDGGLVVNGSIVTRHLDAGAVTAEKIGAAQIGGQHISAQSSILLNEGGRLTVGNNNLILDSNTNSMIVAPDNGTKPGSPNLIGHDYCELANGDLTFFYYFNGAHYPYKSVRRVEAGVGAANNSLVTLPGYWKTVPNIIVSPHSLQTFSKGYVGYNQKINCEAQRISRSASGVVTFVPIANLSLSDGVIFSNPSIKIGKNDFDPSGHTWYTYSSTFYTAQNTAKVYLEGSVFSKDMGSNNDVDAIIEVYIDNSLYYSNTYFFEPSFWGSSFSESWSFTASVAQGVRAITLVAKFKQRSRDNDKLSWGATCNSMTCYQGTFTQLASGTLSYIALGE